MIALFNSWLESLKYFLPQNFVPFFLVSLKSLKEMFINFKNNLSIAIAVILLIILGFNTFDYWHFIPGDFETHYGSLVISSMLFNLALIIILLTFRPSIKLKNLSYYSYKIFGASSLLFWFITSPIMLQRAYGFLSIGLFFLNIFWILFYFDSEQKVIDIFMSLWRALKMFVYNFPFAVILIALFLVIDKSLFLLTEFIFSKYKPILHDSIFILLILFFLPFWVNFYIKRIHDQFSIYYKVKS